MHPPLLGRSTTTMLVASTLLLLLSVVMTGDDNGRLALVSASAIAPRLRSRTTCGPSSAVVSNTASAAASSSITATASSVARASSAATNAPAEMTASATDEVEVDDDDRDDDDAMASTGSSSTTSSSPSQPSSNPLVQLATYVRDTAVNFKNGIGEMNSAHRRCNGIREKQRRHAESVLGTSRPRGIRGIQVGGISYEEYDFLRKGLVDRNKLFAVIMVSLCLPNYFVYYLWSFPDMMPGPFMKSQRDANEISRQRCHAVISVMMDVERGARIAPWSSKLNPFGRGATERAMSRLGDLVESGCSLMAEAGIRGPDGGGTVLRRLGPMIRSSSPITKQQRLLTGKGDDMVLLKKLTKGLTKAINADPLNKGASPFGIGAVQHIESVALADKFLVDQGIDVYEIDSRLIEEACSARLIGGPKWTDEERKEALVSWLREVEIAPRGEASTTKVEEEDGNNVVVQQQEQQQQRCYYNGNMARAVLMCYNAVDGTRDARSDSRLVRVMYQGRKEE
ncbi:hypothetical protein ACHAW5_010038 [Stephanodiscus triporus]|uniref:Letm1 RBD domain-containing protein n=1 Tax=Stephanodiscus triporus TaxID=2934178 RepID=A0ABD3QXX4_9STRA